MVDFIDGARRFQQEMQEPSAARRREKFLALASGQSPDVLFITCADSRIDPCLITGSGPGDLLISRNPGNFVPPIATPPIATPPIATPVVGPAGEALGEGTAAVIEFALVGLGVSHIVICGHSDCGAIKAAHQGIDARQMPQLANWVSHLPAPKLAENLSDPEFDQRFGKALGPTSDMVTEDRPAREAPTFTSLIEENIRQQIKNLKTHQSVKASMADNKLSVHGWFYDIGACAIRILNHDTDEFERF